MLSFLRNFQNTQALFRCSMPGLSVGAAVVICLACSTERTRTVPGDTSAGGSGGASTSGSTSPTTSAGGAGGAGGSAASGGSAATSGGTGGAAGADDGSASDSGGSAAVDAGGSENTSTATEGAGGSAPTDQAPVPGADGELTILEQSFTSVELGWEPASDDVTSEAELEYLVVHSLEDNLSTLELIDEHGTALTGWLAGVDTAVVDIDGGVDNYLAVVVRDAAENRAVYAMLEVPFEEAQSCEVPGDCFSGTCRISYRDQDGDNYGVTADTTGRCDESIPAGYAAVGGDCCDDGGNFGLAADIHPAQTAYFAEAANLCDITWDYDCSGSVEVEYETREAACAADAEAPACATEVIVITEEHCGVDFYGCACSDAGGTCVGACAGPGSPMGCH